MKILYISYWSLGDPLNASAIFPYFPLLVKEKNATITFYTFENSRDKLEELPFHLPGVEHRPLHLRRLGFSALSKLELLMRGRRELIREARSGAYDMIFAKGSMAGSFAHDVHMATGVPYVVESFEPHSEYMAECGVWPRFGFRYRVFSMYERRQVEHAHRIITVTHNHRDDLIASGVAADRVSVIPSITDIERFQFDPQDRVRMRAQLGIGPDEKVGIYVGKFGGLYYDREAFELFKRSMDHFKGMHIVILSPMDHAWIRERALQVGIDPERLHVTSAQHNDVPAFLSASDIAFSPIKPAPVKLYQCPVKNGEYWANGLPILMTDLVADDHRLLRKGIGGSVFGAGLAGLDEALQTMQGILADPDHRVAIAGLARKYKTLDLARAVYDTLF
ncbi:MAG: glycosyltransferase [Flavobacteriales bacterium]|nr:glycosyltransferase [Flavobacteriales bacterium]